MYKGFVKNYWESRYKSGGNSGLGSHDEEAINFKANYVNNLIEKNNIKTVAELGCGDGNQLGLLSGYEKYTGYDISPTITNKCNEMYPNDTSKIFELDIDIIKKQRYDLSLSLDVIYHLVEEDVFVDYMNTMFSIGEYVCLYTTNSEHNTTVPHIKHRNVEEFVSNNYKNYKLIDKTLFHRFNVMFLLYKKI